MIHDNLELDINISIITHFFYPIESGPGNFIYWICKALTREGQNVRIVSTNFETASSPANVWLDTSYGNVIYVKNKKYLFSLPYIIECLKVAATSDIVHLNSLFRPACIIVAIYSILRGKPKLIWSVHGTLFKSALNHHFKRKVLFIKILRLMIPYITLHTSSKAETERVVDLLGKVKIITIPTFMELPMRIEIQNTGPEYFLFIGRLNPIKGIDILLEALFESKKFKRSKVIMRIAGEGSKEYIDYLKSLIKNYNLEEKVEFLGYLPSDQKQELLASAKVLILPSLSEGFGNVVIESLAHRTPVIATKGTPWEILNDSNAGYWIDNNPLQIAHVIDEILSITSIEYETIRKNANQLFLDKFEINAKIDLWRKAYSDIANNRINE